MRTFTNHKRWVAGLVLAAMVTATIAPLAEADHKKRWRRYRGPHYETRVVRHAYPSYYHAPYGSYTVWRSRSGPVIAGFVGGLFLGATLASAAPVGFAYWDPYCHRGFSSLEVYYSHCRGHRHARTVSVVEIPDGYAWDDYRYCDHCHRGYWGEDHDCDD